MACRLFGVKPLSKPTSFLHRGPVMQKVFSCNYIIMTHDGLNLCPHFALSCTIMHIHMFGLTVMPRYPLRRCLRSITWDAGEFDTRWRPKEWPPGGRSWRYKSCDSHVTHTINIPDKPSPNDRDSNDCRNSHFIITDWIKDMRHIIPHFL